ncbi:unnamed protein product [Caenorhabditis bovis]|uniref:Uncharacterized protein n=1 Tax=Caenorhabditis bovis TaxID=2654633 RepID=A0A8S1F693_9PELO|nr:unnamed protein product [Caenorhabditis bovis]
MKVVENKWQRSDCFANLTDEVAAAAPCLAPKTLKTKKALASKANFQKINLRKKTFVRGKVTAEQKRKFRRKLMFKKSGGAR